MDGSNITKTRVAAGIKAGIIRFTEDPNGMENVVCSIGGYWFYFRGEEGPYDERTAEEYVEQTDKNETVRLVMKALDGLRADGFDKEYAYYDAVLSEHGI